MPGRVLKELFDLWCERNQADEYLGTLVNEYLARGGEARAVRAGECYVDIGTLNGYRKAIQLLRGSRSETEREDLWQPREANQPCLSPENSKKRIEPVFTRNM